MQFDLKNDYLSDSSIVLMMISMVILMIDHLDVAVLSLN